MASDRRSFLALTLALAGCGGGEPASEYVNRCAIETATDRTRTDEVEIRFGGGHGHAYEPACVRVNAGTRLTFTGDFEVHPLSPGTLEVPALDAGDGPLREVVSGESATFVMERRGTYPYVCAVHGADGMMGAVFVEP